MRTTQHIAHHLHQVYFGGNWTASNLKDHLNGVTIEIATRKVNDLNTILALTFHIHYYLKGTMDVLKGGDLTIRDTFSFDHPNIRTETEWQDFQANMWTEANEFISWIEKLNDTILETYLAEEKYGTYFRNLAGIIEHTHYHLGQIAIIKKIIVSS
ncbi:DinB family protein [Winogradskyella flava]|uniref:DUF1572 domain-containing protein n=1 Tax=Winogradskyella flava TaxID=1884876 RepID=A0A842IUT2_9FLAO|nr:DinB family protein [Winogradskyella flava]MBC2846731.1 DUF1572 domain-containing protein [Winogradskyella flava]